ncbi:MAG: hypothetical protein R3E83_05565 [Burkholderiaceae bacterium]
MRLTSHTHHALRSLQLPALHHPALVRMDGVVYVNDLARPHIVKVLHELGKAGFWRPCAVAAVASGSVARRSASVWARWFGRPKSRKHAASKA